MRVSVSKHLVYVLLLPSVALPEATSVENFCPDANPSDTDKPETVTEQAKRRWLLCKCGDTLPSGERALVTVGQTRRFLTLLNNHFLARYDENCTGNMEADERRKFLSDQERGLDNRIAAAIRDAERRTSFRALEWEDAARSGEPILQIAALKVLPDPPPERKAVDLAYAFSRDAAQEVETAKVGFKFAEKPWASPTTNSRLSVGFSLDMSQKEVATADEVTRSRAIDVLPISWTFLPLEPLKITTSAGIGYLDTEARNLTTGDRDEEDTYTYTYKLGFNYQTKWECLSLGLEYKIRTDDVFGDRLSYEWLPTVTFDFLKRCVSQK